MDPKTTPGDVREPGQLGRSRIRGVPLGVLFGLPFVVRVVVYAAAGCVLAYLACLVWDFDRLYHGFSTSRMGAWLAGAALIGVLVTAHLLGADGRVHREFGSTDRFVAYHRAVPTTRVATFAHGMIVAAVIGRERRTSRPQRQTVSFLELNVMAREMRRL